MNDILAGPPEIKEATPCPPLIFLFGASPNDMHILCQNADNQLCTVVFLYKQVLKMAGD